MRRTGSLLLRFTVGALVSLMALLVGSLALADSGSYTDAASIPDWAQADVALTSQFRVFRGDASGTFRPGSAISRAEFTAILMRAFSLRPDSSVTVPFTDIAGGWYTDVITQAVQTGVIQAGDFPLQFGPNQPINRAQMARMVARAVDARHVVFTPGPTLTFSDVPASDPFHAAITKATSYGIIKGMGDGTFAPSETATRAQAAVMIARAMRLGKPMEPEVDSKVYKGVITGAFNVFIGAVELAARRTPGTDVDLSPVAQWLTPEAQLTLSVILNRDIPAQQGVGYSSWSPQPLTFIGEDHAILLGRVAGVAGDLQIPVQRQFDGRWRIMSIPFDKIDTSRLSRIFPGTVSVSYTDAAGTYFDVFYDTGEYLRAYLNNFGTRQWAPGSLRILRIGGRNWEESEFRDLVTALHAKVDEQPAKRHYLVTDDAGAPKVQQFATDQELTEAVAEAMMHGPLIYSVDGVSWERLAEEPFFRELLQNAAPNERVSLQLVVRADPNRWVPAFIQVLTRAKTGIMVQR